MRATQDRTSLISYLPNVKCVVRAMAVVVPPLVSVLKLSETERKVQINTVYLHA